jgi:hypothetical protein
MPVDYILASDSKTSSQKYIMANHKPEHMYRLASEHVQGGGWCLVHRQNCYVTRRPDVLVAGLPCPPWARNRDKTKVSKRRGKADMHPDFQTTFELFPEALRHRRPRCFLVEQVPTLQEFNPEWGQTYLQRLLRYAADAGYSCRAMILEAGDWLQWPRQRHSNASKTHPKLLFITILLYYIVVSQANTRRNSSCNLFSLVGQSVHPMLKSAYRSCRVAETSDRHRPMSALAF